MSSPNILVFGGSGRIGSLAALTAHQRGAKVALALRDTLKPTLDLIKDLKRVQADLSQPDSIRTAVEQTGATRAFIYTLFRSKDHMRASITALKEAGIEFVTVLSSAGVKGNPREISPASFVPFVHAQVEISLEDVFGVGKFVTVRPGYFASNLLRWKDMVKKGTAPILFPGAKFDWVDPLDIGTVCGTLLVEGPAALQGVSSIRLLGHALVSQQDAIELLAKAVETHVEVVPLDEKGAKDWYMEEQGVPEPMAIQVISMLKARNQGTDEMYQFAEMEEAKTNSLKFGGREPRTLYEWVNDNKHHFDG